MESTPQARPLMLPLPLFAFALLYGGMICIAGVLGSKQVAIGPLAVDTLIFITIAFIGVRPIAGLIAGQAMAKIVLSVIFVPLLIALLVRIARRYPAS